MTQQSDPASDPHSSADAATLERVKSKAGGRCACTGCPLHERRCLNVDGQRSFGKSSRHSSVRGPIVLLRLVHLDHDTDNTAAYNLDVMCPKCADDYESEARILRMAMHRAPQFPRRISATNPIKGQEGLF
jgi:hypothetical protein